MKKLIAILLTMIIAIGILPFGVSASENIYVTVDGATLNFDQPPIMQNDRVLVPMRLIFETLGATVEWDEYNQYVKATKDDISITMQIGNNTMVKNGQYITLDTAPILLNGRTLVPVRAVAESLEATVEWRGEINTVVIEQKVIPKRYATETVVYAPNAESIITDKDNNIYYIQDNKVMIYKNGIASVYADIDKDFNDLDASHIVNEDAIPQYDDEQIRFRDGVVITIVYNEKTNAVLAVLSGITNMKQGSNYKEAIVDLTNHKLLSYGHYCKYFSSSSDKVSCMIDGNYIYLSDDYANVGKINLSNGQYSEIESPFNNASYWYMTIVNAKITFLVVDNYKVYYLQYNPAKNTFDNTTVLEFDNWLGDGIYVGADGANLYYSKDYNFYQVAPTKQVNQWLSYEEIDYQDQTTISGSGELVFDQEGNILFYDEAVESIRRIKKLN